MFLNPDRNKKPEAHFTDSYFGLFIAYPYEFKKDFKPIPLPGPRL